MMKNGDQELFPWIKLMLLLLINEAPSDLVSPL